MGDVAAKKVCNNGPRSKITRKIISNCLKLLNKKNAFSNRLVKKDCPKPWSGSAQSAIIDPGCIVLHYITNPGAAEAHKISPHNIFPLSPVEEFPEIRAIILFGNRI